MPEVAFRYVLGQLSEEEKQGFEQRYLSDHELFEGLEAVEDDLIDAYVRNELSPDERLGLESHFLVTPERRRRVEFARALAERETRVGPQLVQTSPVVRGGRLATFGGLAAVLAGAAFLYLFRGGVPEPRPEEERTAPPASATAAASNQPAPLPEAAPASGPKTGDPLRGGGIVRAVDVVRYRGARALRVQLQDPTAHKQYVLELEDAQAQSVWTSGPLAAKNPLVEVDLPATLPAGSYFLIVKTSAGAAETLDQAPVALPAP